ncbi:hypothetical protein K6W26_22265 [Burkholderia sp. AU42008]|uniref:hypothetical protein n=1 Tax=unclassified Burkholderia TaxID=2613784 RepID=UPI000B7AEA4C|nr:MULTISPECIES: hypothetical protein [unclassified Burkholderia]MBR8234847.1 hypothetical protein [Burkholderia sp. AU32357]MBY4875784.1 hypothetical protein [Burkholderia sp. AU42008]OXI39281.1 hypothetical protein CFB49_29440 [Burkholderia sp. AU17457]
MPVDFDKLPPEEPVPDRPPSRFVWTIVFFVIVLACIFAVLLLWPKGEPTQSLWFWICITVYPVGIAAFVVLRRYSVFEGRRLDAIAWNDAREKYLSRVFEVASQPLVLVAAAYRFASDTEDDAFNKLLDGSIKLEPRIALKHDAPVNARWFDQPNTDEDGNRFNSDDERQRHVREWVFGELIGDVADAIRALPSELKVAIQLVLPDVANPGEALASWDRQWMKSKLQLHKVEVLPEPLDLMALDAWLDRINQKRDQQARLLVFVRLNSVLQALPSDGSAEAGVALLVMPEPMQHRFKTDSIARLHRPNDTNGCPVDIALARALRWGRMEPSAVSRIWQCALDPAVKNAVTAAVVKAGITGTATNIDYIVGHASEVASWLGIACAARAIARDGTPQLLVTAGKSGTCFSVLRNGGSP